MPLIIEPGQSKNLAFDIRTTFDETFELFNIVRPNILDWQNGAPRPVILMNETYPVEHHDGREPATTPVVLQKIDPRRFACIRGIKMTLSLKSPYTKKTKLEIAENFKTAFLDNASYWATYIFLQETVAKIDFAGEYAGNVIPWDFINPGDHDNIRGLSFKQIYRAKTLLEGRRLPSKDLVLIAPVEEKMSLSESNSLLYSTLGVQGAPLNSQITNDIIGIPTWWVPNNFFIELGLCTDDIDGAHANHHGIYVYMVNRDDLYFITSIGSEVVADGTPWIHENMEYQSNAAHLIVGRYAVGAAMKNYENCIRIDCRLD